MKVAVLYGYVPPGAPADERDVLVEVDAVSGALAELGHETAGIPVTLDLKDVAERLREACPDIAFNLVESVDGKGSLIHLAPVLLDTLGLPYTGCPAEPVFTTSGKLLSKRMMKLAGIPTAPWHVMDGPVQGFVPGRPLIIKSVWEHASIGLDQASVVTPDTPEVLAHEIEKRRVGLGGEAFAEEYIEGREFNISLVGAVGEPAVLPPAEIVFSGYSDGRRRLVDYRAKWEEGSVEYGATVRSFLFPDSDRGLIDEIAAISKDCWRVFGLSGYARVDFRVDGEGRPWVLEVNVNPCISPDSGFVAAAKAAGMDYKGLVSSILDCACKKPPVRV